MAWNKKIRPICSVDGCDNPHDSRGYCVKHITRLRRYGDVHTTQRVQLTDIDFEKKFWQKAILTSDIDKCWEWQRARKKYGYGEVGLRLDNPYIKLKTPLVKAHRLAYAIYYKQDPGALFVMHKCDNPSCINPHHLTLGTCKDNNQDKAVKGRAPRGETHYHAKLTEAEVGAIRQQYHAGVNYKEIATNFSIHPNTVSPVVNGKRWGHIE